VSGGSERSGSGATGGESGASTSRTFRFPTAFTVLFTVLILVWIASFFVPAGVYKTDPQTGATIPGTYHKLPSCSAPATTEDQSAYAQPQYAEQQYAAPAPAPSPDPFEQLTKLGQLRDSGVLTEEEFAASKAKILGI
jgi:hypothetical protein